ncbi:HEAT repeat domain-containing protein [Actinomadura sediminis]|uniref:HEAT repeat domain-containing protein n=1 Tax=Actinomadura sediminis TaxID=1038904 RepID=A0ABW3EYR8_9ACTN
MHAIGVEAAYKKQTACPGQFAYIVLDFEPAETYTFVNALAPGTMEYPDSEARFVPVVDETAHERLENHLGAGPLPVRVTLRAARDHPTDSSETSFRVATVLAVRRALERTGRERFTHAETLEAPTVADARRLLDDPRHVFQGLDLCGGLFSGPPHGTVGLLRPLASLVGSPDDRVALRAVRVLARAPHRRARDLIAAALSRAPGEARDRAVRTLAERADPRAAEPLAELLTRDSLPNDIAWPVHAMKAHAPVLLPPLRARLDAVPPPTEGDLEPFLLDVIVRVSHWNDAAAPLAPSLRRVADLYARDRPHDWTSGELRAALRRITGSG